MNETEHKLQNGDKKALVKNCCHIKAMSMNRISQIRFKSVSE